MTSNVSLEDLIRSKDIEFFSSGRKLDTNLDNFEKYNLDLMKHVVKQSGSYLTIKGDGLQDYLINADNLYALAAFAVHFLYVGTGSIGKKSHLAIHVDVDIEKAGQHYQKPTEEKLFNGLGKAVVDATSWVPEMPYFEKLWNFAIDYAVSADCHGHPGDEGSFRYIVSEFAENFLIGTPQQIPRYKRYALDVLPAVTKIADDLKNNPQGIFVDYTLLHSLETVAHHARLIAANVAHFSVE